MVLDTAPQLSLDPHSAMAMPRVETAQVAATAEDVQPARAPRAVPYIAFFAAVLASMAAAAAVVNNDLPIMVVGLL